MNGSGSSAPSALPETRSTGSSRGSGRELAGGAGRVVPREQPARHARVPRRPSRRRAWTPIADALRGGGRRAASRSGCAPRATARRGASACSSSTTTAARRTRSPSTCTRRLARSASTSRSGARWLPHVTVAPLPRAAAAAARRCRTSATVVPSDAAVYLSRAAPGGAQYEVLETVAARRSIRSGSRAGSRRRPRADRAAVRQGLGHEDERPAAGVRRRRLDGLALARPRARHRRPAARPHRRDLRPGVVGQDDARLPRDRRGAAARRHLRLHRRRARDGPAVREADRRQHRRAARLAARHGRAGARDHRAAHPLGRARRRRRSTRSPRCRRRRRSRARWATATSASRRA